PRRTPRRRGRRRPPWPGSSRGSCGTLSWCFFLPSRCGTPHGSGAELLCAVTGIGILVSEITSTFRRPLLVVRLAVLLGLDLRERLEAVCRAVLRQVAPDEVLSGVLNEVRLRVLLEERLVRRDRVVELTGVFVHRAEPVRRVGAHDGAQLLVLDQRLENRD